MKHKNVHFLRGAGLATIVVSAAVALSLTTMGFASQSTSSAVSGFVRDANSPIVGATVRVKATDKKTITDSHGHFVLSDLSDNEPVVLTAWAQGYYIGGGKDGHLAGETGIEIVLTAHGDTDNPDYVWLSAFADAGYEGSGENSNCENCHADPNNSQAALPFSEWLKDAHALSAKNSRFLTMYNGTDMAGNQSPETQYFQTRDYGRIPLRPDPNEPYFGSGYKLDFPGTAGNCAACHTPAASIDAPYNTDPTAVSGVGAEGAACDFCHKVWSVGLDPISGLPYPNMPGVLSFESRRPAEGHQFFAGPFDDVAPGEDTYSPLQKQSQYCAPCHFGVFWNTTVYNSFGEWLDSPYSNPETGKTCQDCHMPPGLNNHFARLDKGGVIRDPQTIFSHFMPGASDDKLLQNAVDMDVMAEHDGERFVVTVTITNDQTGHHVPTDSPLRHLILIVKATDSQGNLLDYSDGPVIPKWCGTGDPNEGYYGGLPGKAFAKVLEELWTDVSPTAAYWNPTRILSDNRIAAFATDSSTYTFIPAAEGKITVEVVLIFRRAFIDLASQKDWETHDIVMESKVTSVSGP